MARLQTLKPRIQAAPQSRVKVLDAKVGTTEMERGRAWMAKRHRIALAHGYQCAGCGFLKPAFERAFCILESAMTQPSNEEIVVGKVRAVQRLIGTF